MTETTGSAPLTRQAISAAVTPYGWRYVLGLLRAHVAVGSLADALAVGRVAAEACGADADAHLWADARCDVVVLSLQTRATAAVSGRDIELARVVTGALADHDVRPDVDIGGPGARSAQVLELAIDALDITAVRPFWKAVLGYVDEPGHAGAQDPLVDALGQSPAVWFQQMDAPRPQRNRIHVDVSVPHDEAVRRIEVALGAGGALVSDAAAPAFWVLADAEGNEACVTTWQGRDP
jgi:4a-hydroxytetrahydrobiopterin dehydratase